MACAVSNIAQVRDRCGAMSNLYIGHRCLSRPDALDEIPHVRARGVFSLAFLALHAVTFRRAGR